METSFNSGASGITTMAEVKEKELMVDPNENDMGRHEFLQLFTEQLKNQNPLDPMKNEAFVAQLAQFSQLEATTNMSDSMADMVSVMHGDRIMTGSHLIGKSIYAQSRYLNMKDENPVEFGVDLPAGAQEVVVQVNDPQTGQLLRQFEVGPFPSGMNTITWDGYDMNGQLVSPGTYRVGAKATSNGFEADATVYANAEVQSVAWNPRASDIQLRIAGGQEVNLSDVKGISQ